MEEIYQKAFDAKPRIEIKGQVLLNTPLEYAQSKDCPPYLYEAIVYNSKQREFYTLQYSVEQSPSCAVVPPSKGEHLTSPLEVESIISTKTVEIETSPGNSHFLLVEHEIIEEPPINWCFFLVLLLSAIMVVGTAFFLVRRRRKPMENSASHK